MDKVAKESLLFDFYGELLTDKKRRIVELYHEDDMSLSEIAEDMGVSRAAVYDALKSAEEKLAYYESKLGLVRKYEKREALFEKADRAKASGSSLSGIFDQLRAIEE